MSGYVSFTRPSGEASIYLYNTSWNLQNSEYVYFNPGSVRRMRVVNTGTIPTGKRFLTIKDCKFYRSYDGNTTSLGYNNYTTSVTEVNNKLENNTIYEISYDDFATYENASILDEQETEFTISFTTHSNNFSLIIVFPSSFYVDDTVVQWQLTTSGNNCTFSPSSGTFDDSDQVQVTITPDSGYTFTDSSQITVDGATVTWTFNNGVATGTFNIFNNVSISATALLLCNITMTGVNCTPNYPSTTVPLGTTLSLVFTPDQGYELYDASQIVSTVTGISWAFSNGIATASFTASSNLDLTATASLIVTRYTLTTQATNCTITPSSGSYEEDSTLNIVVAPSSGYKLPSVQPETTGSVVWQKQGANWLGVATFNGNISITATATIIITVDYDLTNATAYPDEETEYTTGDTVEITVTADYGMYFDTVPYVRYQDALLNWYNVPLTVVDTQATYHRVYSFTKVIGTGLNAFKNATLVAISQAQPLIDDFAVFNIYNPTLAQLTAVANSRYDMSEDMTYYYHSVDLGDFVISLQRVFVPVATSVNANIMLGGYDTGVQAQTIIYPYSSLDCGSVTILPIYNNEMDYNYTDIRIYIPFYGFANLDTAKYIGKTVSLIYECELITGRAVAKLLINEELIDFFTCKISTDIPYLLTLDGSTHGSYQLNELMLLDRTPKIIVESNLPYNTSGVKAKNDCYRLISSMSGYQKFDIEAVNIPCTNTEMQKIIALCSEGVIL